MGGTPKRFSRNMIIAINLVYFPSQPGFVKSRLLFTLSTSHMPFKPTESSSVIISLKCLFLRSPDLLTVEFSSPFRSYLTCPFWRLCHCCLPSTLNNFLSVILFSPGSFVLFFEILSFIFLHWLLFLNLPFKYLFSTLAIFDPYIFLSITLLSFMLWWLLHLYLYQGLTSEPTHPSAS